MDLLMRSAGHGDFRHGQAAPTCRCLQATQTLACPTRQTKIGSDIVARACGHQCTGPPHPQFSIPAPDVAMQGVARYKDRYFSQELFYEQAANGSLPQFVWFNPPFQASDHPCQDVAKGVSK